MNINYLDYSNPLSEEEKHKWRTFLEGSRGRHLVGWGRILTYMHNPRWVRVLCGIARNESFFRDPVTEVSSASVGFVYKTQYVDVDELQVAINIEAGRDCHDWEDLTVEFEIETDNDILFLLLSLDNVNMRDWQVEEMRYDKANTHPTEEIENSYKESLLWVVRQIFGSNLDMDARTLTLDPSEGLLTEETALALLRDPTTSKDSLQLRIATDPEPMEVALSYVQENTGDENIGFTEEEWSILCKARKKFWDQGSHSAYYGLLPFLESLLENGEAAIFETPQIQRSLLYSDFYITWKSALDPRFMLEIHPHALYGHLSLRIDIHNGSGSLVSFMGAEVEFGMNGSPYMEVTHEPFRLKEFQNEAIRVLREGLAGSSFLEPGFIVFHKVEHGECWR